MTSEQKIRSFSEFWPHYLREHSKPWTRRLHFLATTFSFGVLVAAILLRKLELVPVAFVVGYGPAWISHGWIEKNRPLTFRYPVWSLLADLRMWLAMLSWPVLILVISFFLAIAFFRV
jgi:hypothetical protein